METGLSDIKLFRTAFSSVDELPGSAVALERSLQSLFEKNLEALLGVTFLASEFSTSNGGRMDTLGIDENRCPVIIEYKRDRNENVINQGLFYLDWLMDHRGDFEMLVAKQFCHELASAVEWSSPRLICIAGDFTKYDEHAVKQMGRNISLIRYRRFGEDLLLLERLAEAFADPKKPSSVPAQVASLMAGKQVKYKTVSEYLDDAEQPLRDLYEDVRNHLLGLGEDVTEKTLQFYVAFRRIKNFACVEVKPQLGLVRLYLKVDPDSVDLVDGFTRDVRKVGHFGTGDLEVTVANGADFEKAKPLILMSYEAS
jgi:predicted transport protein